MFLLGTMNCTQNKRTNFFVPLINNPRSWVRPYIFMSLIHNRCFLLPHEINQIAIFVMHTAVLHLTMNNFQAEKAF